MALQDSPSAKHSTLAAMLSTPLTSPTTPATPVATTTPTRSRARPSRARGSSESAARHQASANAANAAASTIPSTAGPLCGYIHRICTQDRLDGFEFCVRHILNDKNAPFKQCAYLHASTNKRCPNAARKTDRRDATLCPFHMSKLSARRRQQQVQQHRLNLEDETPSDELKKHLRNLEHYCATGRHEKKRLNDNWIIHEDGTTNASDALRYKIGEAAALMQDSDSDEELGNPTIDELLRTNQMESDCESIESDHEDVLQRAGTMAPEEVSRVLRDKMLRLKDLYTQQFTILQQTYKDRRRKFLYALKEEKETPGLQSIASTVAETVALGGGTGVVVDASTGLTGQGTTLTVQLEEYKKLKALLRCSKTWGHEALIKRQVDELRKANANGGDGEPQESTLSSKPTCIHIKDGQRCDHSSLPLSHYCRQHILYDRSQYLFRPCASGNPPCLTPCISFTYKNACFAHATLKEDPQETAKTEAEPANTSPVETGTDSLMEISSAVPAAINDADDMQLGDIFTDLPSIADL